MLFFSPELKSWFHSEHLDVPIPNATLACSIERATAEHDTEKIDWAALSEYRSRAGFVVGDIYYTPTPALEFAKDLLEKELHTADFLASTFSDTFSIFLKSRERSPLPDKMGKDEIIRNFVRAKNVFINELRETGCSTKEAKRLARACLNAVLQEELT